ncbi:MAG: DUF4876 domain-containing protein [Bacteroides sp.]
MKTGRFLYLLLLVLPMLLTACQDEENTSCTVSIQLIAPADCPALTFDDLLVTLTSKNGQATSYTARCNAIGLSVFNVEYGEYSAAVHYQMPSGAILNGRIESVLLDPRKENESQAIPLLLSHAKTNALIIKEIYYGGCLDKEGEWYMGDQYVTLYNNSAETLYLDGLCLAVVNPGTNFNPSPWIEENPNMKLIPVHDFTWQFPGKGNEHPLLPGTSTTIAANAVDHTSGEYGHPGAINLSKVDWAFWNETFKKQAIPSLGVTSLNLLLRTNPYGNKYNLPTVGPAFMVFSLQAPEGAEAYVTNESNRKPQPGANIQNLKYLMVPREWILDCVDCVESKEQVPNYRVPVELNSVPAYMPMGSFKGYSLIRKQATTVNGRIVYQDTNNSAEDLTTIPASLKNQ